MAQGIDEWNPRAGRDRPTVQVPGVVLRRTGNHATVVITGRLTPEKTAEAFWIVRGLVGSGALEVVVDLTDSWEVAVLLPGLARARSELARRGGVLRLDGVAVPELLAALVAAPLDEVFLVYDAVRHETRQRRSVRRRTDWSTVTPVVDRSA